MTYPNRREFERYGLERPDFRRRFWRQWARNPRALLSFRDKLPQVGSGEWWAWVESGYREIRFNLHFFKKILEFSTTKCPLPLSSGSGKTVKFVRYQPLEEDHLEDLELSSDPNFIEFMRRVNE